MRSNRFDILLLVLLIAGAIGLGFVGGAAIQYFKVPGFKSLTDAFMSASTWYDSFKPPSPHEEEEDVATNEQASEILRTPKVQWNEALAYKGYTLISTGFSDSAYLVDMQGNVVYRWDAPFRKVFPDPKHIHTNVSASVYINYARVYPNGDLLLQYSALGDTPYGYGLAKLDKNSNVLWTYAKNAHHHFYIDKEGAIYGLIHEFLDNPPPPLDSAKTPVLTDYIVKLSPEGKELERISILDAFLDSPFSLILYHRSTGTRSEWDVLHTNTIVKLEPDMADKFPMFKPGSLLISSRSLSYLAVIDPDTHKVVWAQGGLWKLQHDSQFLPNGHILLLDNAGHYEGTKKYSRVIEFDPATNGVTWYFTGAPKKFYTGLFGRVQRLPNGNTLIDEAMTQRVWEVTPSGEVVWSYSLRKVRDGEALKNAIVTATRYDASQLPFLAK